MTPDIAALEDEAPLVEWPEKTDVSILAESSNDYSHLAIVDDTTGSCGFVIPRNSSSGIHLPVVSLDLKMRVATS